MILNKRIVLILLFVIAGLGNLNAKETDTRTWVDLFATRKFGRATVGFIGEFYTMNDNTSIERYSVGLKGDYELLPWLNAGSGYILLNFFRPGYHELADRFYFQAEPIWHYGNLHFSFRERMQFTLYPESRTDQASTCYWRNRFEASWYKGSSKLEPVIDLESLYLFNNKDSDPSSEFRYTLGVNYHFAKNQKFKFYGMLTTTSILDRYIFGVVYDLKL